MNDDVISRKAAIDKLKREEKIFYSPAGLKYLIGAIRDLPSAQPEIEERKEESAQNVPKEDLISRKAAIEVIDAVFPVDPMKSEYAQGIACGAALAKTYVEQLPSAQPEKRTENAQKTHACDLISRQAAIKYLMTNMNWYDKDGYESDEDYKRECITELINGVPSVQPDRKKGKWLTNEEIVRPTRFIEWHCSSCGKVMEAMGPLGFNFCPNCGSYNGGDDV